MYLLPASPAPFFLDHVWQATLNSSGPPCPQVAGPSLLTWSSIDTALTRTVHVHVNCAPAGGLLTVQLLADSNVAVAVNSSAATLQLPAPQFALGATQVSGPRCALPPNEPCRLRAQLAALPHLRHGPRPELGGTMPQPLTAWLQGF